MTRLEVLNAAGLFSHESIDDAIDELNETFGCPTGVDCTVDISCQECWRKWLEEEVKLQ